MLRSAQPSQFTTYPSQNIDIPVLAVLKIEFSGKCKMQEIQNSILLPGQHQLTLSTFSKAY